MAGYMSAGLIVARLADGVDCANYKYRQIVWASMAVVTRASIRHLYADDVNYFDYRIPGTVGCSSSA